MSKKIISLQLDDELLSMVEKEADENFRSLSAQVRLILVQYFKGLKHNEEINS